MIPDAPESRNIDCPECGKKMKFIKQTIKGQNANYVECRDCQEFFD